MHPPGLCPLRPKWLALRSSLRTTHTTPNPQFPKNPPRPQDLTPVAAAEEFGPAQFAGAATEDATEIFADILGAVSDDDDDMFSYNRYNMESCYGI